MNLATLIHEELTCLFMVCETRTPTVNPRRRRFDTEKPLERERLLEIQREQRRRQQQQTAEQKEDHSMNFEC